MSLFVLPGNQPDVRKCYVLLFSAVLTCMEYQTGGRREATSVLLFSALSLVLIGSFQSFSGTSAAQNNGVPRARVHYRSSRARLWPLFTAERLAGLPAELPLPCYLRADKGGRCEEEINVNPSVFN